MTSQADWETVPTSSAAGSDRLFFDERQRGVIEAAAARIIPTDDDPGAAEAKVVEFIDRYLSGTGFIYASADGSGFLRIEGKEADAWAARVRALQEQYSTGIAEIDATSQRLYRRDFVDVAAHEQDEVLIALSGWPKPSDFSIGPVVQGREPIPGEGGAPPSNQPIPDDELAFFPMLVLHVRQGFYSDPVYGGNEQQVGWQVIGFPGPASLADTQAGRYTTIDYMLPDVKWPYSGEQPNGT